MIWVDTHLHIPRDHPDAGRLMDFVTRPNPEFQSAQKLGFSTHGIPRELREFEVRGNEVILPRELAHDLPVGTDCEDRSTLGDRVDLGKPIQLRDYQRDAVTATVQELEVFRGAVLRAAPGAGKTVASLEVARRLGRRTLVLVHKSFLMNQWVDRIREFLGVETGFVWQDRFDVDKPIVIAMAQTLHARDYHAEQFASFGTLIVDETHRFSADTFVASVARIPARYRLGVTATPKRKDGLEWVFHAHIGPVAVTMELTRESPDVYIIPTVIDQVNEAPLMRPGGKPDFVKTVTFLTSSAARNRQIVTYLVDAAQNGRRVIVFSDRLKHLEDLAELFASECAEAGVNATFGFFVGGMTEEQRVISAGRQVVFSTTSFASEGLDVPELDTCVLASPKASIIQIVGRVQRSLPGKPKPVVLDFVDGGLSVCRGLAWKRAQEYANQKWVVNDWRL